MLLVLHILSFCATFIFQTSPRESPCSLSCRFYRSEMNAANQKPRWCLYLADLNEQVQSYQCKSTRWRSQRTWRRTWKLTIRWRGYQVMNNIYNRAEETVLSELVYGALTAWESSKNSGTVTLNRPSTSHFPIRIITKLSKWLPTTRIYYWFQNSFRLGARMVLEVMEE